MQNVQTKGSWTPGPPNVVKRYNPDHLYSNWLNNKHLHYGNACN